MLKDAWMGVGEAYVAPGWVVGWVLEEGMLGQDSWMGVGGWLDGCWRRVGWIGFSFVLVLGEGIGFSFVLVMGECILRSKL